MPTSVPDLPTAMTTFSSCSWLTNSGIYPYGTGAMGFMLIALVNDIFDALPANFPRLDKHKACPPALRASVVKACTL
jgi:hypothetical protein